MGPPGLPRLRVIEAVRTVGKERLSHQPCRASVRTLPAGSAKGLLRGVRRSGPGSAPTRWENAVHTLSDVRIEIEERQDGIQLARTAGELDALGAPVLRDCLDRRIDADRRFVLDLDEVTFLGSAGLEVLLDTNDRAVLTQVKWALVGNHRPVARPLQVTGLSARLPMRPSVPAAILELTEVVPSAR